MLSLVGLALLTLAFLIKKASALTSLKVSVEAKAAKWHLNNLMGLLSDSNSQK